MLALPLAIRHTAKMNAKLKKILLPYINRTKIQITVPDIVKSKHLTWEVFVCSHYASDEH